MRNAPTDDPHAYYGRKVSDFERSAPENVGVHGRGGRIARSIGAVSAFGSPSDPEVDDARARLAAVEAELALTREVMERDGSPDVARTPHLLPSDDIWDDDDEWESSGIADAEDRWGDPADEVHWRDAQVVMHDDDGTVYEEPFDDPVYDGGEDEAAASRMVRWGHESLMGAAMMGFGRGLEKVLHQPEPTEILFEVDDDTDEPERAVSLLLVPGHPERSVAHVRRWLLRRRAADPGPED